MRVGLYARVSKERCKSKGCGHLYEEHRRSGRCTHRGCKCRKFDGQNPENQLLELRRYATAQGWEIIEYVDRATGKDANRDALKEAFQDASRRKFDVLLVWALDRLSREGISKTFQHLQRLRDYGVQFESFSEPQFRTTGPFGEVFAELMIAFAAWAAKTERQRNSDRTKAGLARARSEGRIGGRPARIFNRETVARMRAENPPVSWRRISLALGIPPPTLRKAMKQRASQVGTKRLPKKR